MSLLDTASLIITPNGYKEGTLYSVIPNTTLGDMTVVRATTATRVNSAGLIELVPYNLLQYSEQFNNGVWGLYSSGTGVNPIVTANTTTAPNGTITADTIVLNAGAGTTINDQSGIYQIFQEATGVTYTCSFYAKGLVGGEQVMVRHANGILYTKFTLTNDWARYTLTETAISTGTIFLEIVIRRSLNEPINANATFYIWGAQLVEGSVAKDYLRTETRLNIPRLDYSNGTCPSLLVEPQRTNLVLYSEQFDNADWNNYALNVTVTANTTISPDGTQNADTVAFGAFGFLYQSFAIIGLASATFSIYAKTATQIIVFGGATPLGTDIYTTINVENGWFRQILTRTFTGGGTGTLQILPFGNNVTAFLWGCQVEAGSYPTSYIPTTTAAVTRNADEIYKTGISSLIGQTEGTIFIDFDIDNILSQTINPVIFSFSGTSYIRLFTTGEINYFESNSVIVASSVGIINNGQNKIAVNYKNNDFSIYANGVLVGSNNSGAVVAKSQIGLYYLASTIYNPSLFYNLVTLFPTKLTGAECISLTT